ncbi:MAG: DUF2849 domain-containing protein [Rhodobacteraceae bacterium]|nr:DUF2849 domain-containing protein [Paracoccaceae bacterium]
MARRFTPKIITTNDLLEGDVIYLTADGSWTRRFSDAKLFLEQAEAEAALARIETRQDIHVGAYLADAETGIDGRPQPVHFREQFRATGPSNYFHGKQAETGDVQVQ